MISRLGRWQLVVIECVRAHGGTVIRQGQLWTMPDGSYRAPWRRSGRLRASYSDFAYMQRVALGLVRRGLLRRSGNALVLNEDALRQLGV